MKATSSKSHQRYLRIFSALLVLFPRAYRETYSPLMLQLLNDNLRDAEQVGDHHTTREVFLSAVFEIPGSALSAWWMNRNQEISFGTNGWLVYSIFFLLATAIASILPYASPFPDSSSFYFIPLAGIAAVVSLPLAAFNYTRQFRYTFFVLLPALILWGISSFILTPLLSTFGNDFFNTALPSFTIPVLASYGQLAWYRFHPIRYRRGALASLSKQEIAEFRAKLLRKRRLTLQVVGTLAFIFIAANLVALHDPRKEYPDLAVAAVTVKPEENAAITLNNLPEPFPVGSYGEVNQDTFTEVNRYITGTAWNDARVATLLTDSVSERKTFLAAADLPYFQDPGFSNPHAIPNVLSAPIIQMNGFLSTSSTIFLDAEAQARQGKTSQAVEEVLKAAGLGQKMTQGQNTVITYLVGLKMRTRALAYLNGLMQRFPLDRQSLSSIKQTVGNYADTGNGQRAALKLENYLTTQGLQQLRSSGFAPFPLNSLAYLPYFFQPNDTYNRINETQRTVIARTYLTCDQIPDEATIPLNPSWRDLGINSLGRFMNRNVLPSLNGLNFTRCNDDFFKEATLVHVALLQYRTDHDTLPDNLAALIPTYLEKVPLDPNTGKPILFDKSKNLLFSTAKPRNDSQPTLEVPL